MRSHIPPTVPNTVLLPGTGLLPNDGNVLGPDVYVAPVSGSDTPAAAPASEWKIIPDGTQTQPQVSATGQQMYDAVKQWHPNDADYGWPGLMWCEALCSSGLDTVVQLASDTDDYPGWSSIMDLNRCPDEDLPFLAQFRGITIPQGMAPAAARALILTQPQEGRGRPASIIAAVKATLTGSQYVNLVERDTGSAWHALVQVFASQMPNQAATQAAIQSQKPAMDIITLQVLSGPTYTQIRSSLPSDSYTARKTTYPTYNDVQGYNPP